MVLHEARVLHGAEGRIDANAAAGFLHNDGEDEAVVDERLLRDLLDAVVDVLDFVAAVVRHAELVAARGQGCCVGVPHVFE